MNLTAQAFLYRKNQKTFTAKVYNTQTLVNLKKQFKA